MLLNLHEIKKMKIIKMKKIMRRSKNTRRFRQEYIGRHRNMEAVFRQENFCIFPVHSDHFPVLSRQKLVGNHQKKSGNFPAGILLPCSADFRCIPAGSSVFSVSFLQVPSGSDHRNLRPGWRLHLFTWCM